MKRLFLLSAIAIVAICSSSCGSSSKQESQSDSSSKQESQSDSSQSGAPAKPEPPERQGWWEYFPLYGDVESVVVAGYELEEKFGEVVRGDIKDSKKYYFNKAGDVIERVWYNSNGSLRYKHIYKYDASGNVIEGVVYNSDGSLDSKLIYKYDASGNKIEYAVYNSDGSLDSKHIYKYDASGNMIEMTEYSGEALLPDRQTVYEITYRK